MKIKQITVPISQEHPQPTKVSLKSIEGDLDVMVSDLNKHIAAAITTTSEAHFHNATDLPAGGADTVGIKVGTSGIGMFFGTGAPTLTAPQGSLYIRADGTTTNDRFYIRTASGWTAGTTAA